MRYIGYFGEVGELIEERNGKLCVLTAEGKKWWFKANSRLVEQPNVSALSPEAAAELLRRLEDASARSPADDAG